MPSKSRLPSCYAPGSKRTHPNKCALISTTARRRSSTPWSPNSPDRRICPTRLSCTFMTKVQLRFRLRKPPDEPTLARLEEVHSKYGILKIQLNDSLDT